jgi:protein tyrosine phosphatase
MKNRFPDILPYDHSRIELPSTKDDYINASYIKNLTHLAPPFIVTQAPLPSTYTDFWTMVWEQQVEVIVCLLSDSEVKGKFVELVVWRRMWDLLWWFISQLVHGLYSAVSVGITSCNTCKEKTCLGFYGRYCEYYCLLGCDAM